MINQAKTLALLAMMTALCGFIGVEFMGDTGGLVGIGIAVGFGLLVYFRGAIVALRAHQARPLADQDEPDLQALSRQLAYAAGIPRPMLFLTNCKQPNAFAVGRDPAHAGIVVSQGLLDLLGAEEMAGVISHELAHIRNRDTLTMTASSVLAGLILGFGGFGVLVGLGARRKGGLFVIVLSAVMMLAAVIVHMALSRNRELAADAAGAKLCGHPEWLARALEKIEACSSIENIPAQLNPATAPLFIIDPVKRHGFYRLFASHPSTELRITRLNRMAAQMSRAMVSGR